MLGNRKKIGKCLIRTFSCRSTFLYEYYNATMKLHTSSWNKRLNISYTYKVAGLIAKPKCCLCVACLAAGLLHPALCCACFVLLFLDCLAFLSVLSCLSFLLLICLSCLPLLLSYPTVTQSFLPCLLSLAACFFRFYLNFSFS